MSRPIPADARVKLVAAEFCVGHVATEDRREHGLAVWPCASCRSRARNALASIDGLPRLFTPQPPEPAPLVELDAMPAPATHADATDTERAARWQLEPRVGTQRRLVLDAFLRDELVDRVGPVGRVPNGWTDDELVAYVHPSSARRRVELFHGGWLRDSGQRRQTRAGSSAIVWRVTTAGLARTRRDVSATA